MLRNLAINTASSEMVLPANDRSINWIDHWLLITLTLQRTLSYACERGMSE